MSAAQAAREFTRLKDLQRLLRFYERQYGAPFGTAGLRRDVIEQMRRLAKLVKYGAPALVLLLLAGPALAQEHRHPAADMPLHDSFYSRWMMPSDRSKSCCNRQDCAPARAFFEHGRWMVWSKIRSAFIEVPKGAIESEADVPMGAHLCENSSGILCFGVGTGG